MKPILKRVEEEHICSNSKRIIEYDEKGNLIHTKDSDNYESFYKYDENNNNIHFKDSNGHESYCKYDENNNLISYTDNIGIKETREYINNKLSSITIKTKLRDEHVKFNYDKEGDLINKITTVKGELLYKKEYEYFQ